MAEEMLWVKEVEEGTKVGLTPFAQDDLGGVSFVLLPKVGRVIEKGEEIVEIEAEKAVVEYESPVAGTIVAINEEAAKTPSILDQPDAWLYIVK